MDFSDPISALLPGVSGRVLLVLARSGLPMTGLTIAQLADASPEGARKVLIRLKAHGIVTSSTAGASLLYEVNRRHLLWPAIRGLAGAADESVATIKHRISAVIEREVPERDVDRVTVAIFGSVARGEAGLDSDVDVLLIVPNQFDDDLIDDVEFHVIDDVTNSTGNACSVYAMRRSRFEHLVAGNDPMVASWDADAVVFHGPDFRRRLRGGPWDEQ